MQQCAPGDALPEHHVPGVIHADDVKHQLGNVDDEYAHLLCHEARLLWMNGCPKCRNHSGSSKPSWKEADPLHYILLATPSRLADAV
jgi:hypothetical protein